ncbi:MAG: carbonic anhydrase [Parasphingorhabdus sp.]|jgi:carbonic anhydrase
MKQNIIQCKHVACIAILVAFGFTGMAAWASSSSSEKKEEHTSAPEEKKDHGGVHWAYTGSSGPAYWGELVNIQADGTADLYRLKFHYQPVSLQVLNNGHTLQANYSTDSDGQEVTIGEQSYLIYQKADYNSELMLGDVPYKLLQFHLLTPSEHAHDGERYAMEVHLVHKSADGNLAVVGMFLKRGGHNSILQKILDNVSSTINKVSVNTEVRINAADLLPEHREYYHYSGSLTTPPCSENVNWLVMKTAIQVSDQQVSRFIQLVGENARPLQNLNWRNMLVSH